MKFQIILWTIIRTGSTQIRNWDCKGPLCTTVEQMSDDERLGQMTGLPRLKVWRLIFLLSSTVWTWQKHNEGYPTCGSEVRPHLAICELFTPTNWPTPTLPTPCKQAKTPPTQAFAWGDHGSVSIPNTLPHYSPPSIHEKHSLHKRIDMDEKEPLALQKEKENLEKFFQKECLSFVWQTEQDMT